MICPHCNKEITPIPFELKATYQSSNKSIEENIHWIRQCMSQAYVVSSPKIILSRFEIMSDWKFVFGKKEEKAVAKRPTLSVWRVEFTQEELDKFWLWLKERKILYEEILRTGVLVPKVVALASGQEWECGFCSYKEECDGNTKLNS